MVDPTSTGLMQYWGDYTSPAEYFAGAGVVAGTQAAGMATVLSSPCEAVNAAAIVLVAPSSSSVAAVAVAASSPVAAASASASASSSVAAAAVNPAAANVIVIGSA